MVIKSFHVVGHRLPLVFVLPLLCCGCVQAFPSLGLLFTELLLRSGFPQFWSWLCWAVVLLRLPSFLVLLLQGCSYAQAFLGLCLSSAGLCFFLQASLVFFFSLLGYVYAQTFPTHCLAFDGLWFSSDFLQSLFYLCWAIVIHRFPNVLVLPLLGCGCK